MPMMPVLTVMAIRTLTTISSLLTPEAKRVVAIEPASTLRTATAGVSGPPVAGESVVGRATMTPVTTVPISNAASPSGKPAAIGSWKMSPPNELKKAIGTNAPMKPLSKSRPSVGMLKLRIVSTFQAPSKAKVRFSYRRSANNRLLIRRQLFRGSPQDVLAAGKHTIVFDFQPDEA